MAEEKKKEEGKKTSTTAKPKKNTVKKKVIVKEAPKEPAKEAPKSEQSKKANEVKSKKTDIATKQRYSLIMFVTAVVLIAIIFIPGEMIWLWAHNAVRGLFSMLALFWPLLLLFLSVATMLDRQIPKLAFRTAFSAAFVAALNACIYIFTYSGDINVHQTFNDGIQYKGGGVLGFIFGIPFLKLFGQTPAKILIIVVMLVLLMFATNISIKNVYAFVFDKVSSFFSEQGKALRKKKKSKNPVKIADDAFFDSDDDFEDFDIDDDSEDEEEFEPMKTDDEELPQSPVFAVDSNEDEDFFGGVRFDEDENIPENNFDDDYSIDISIDDPIEEEPPKKKVSVAKVNNSEKAAPQNDDFDDDEILKGLFGEEFMDSISHDNNGEKTEASKVAENISHSKMIPKKSHPEQKQYDPQTVPIDPPPKKKVRDKNSYPYPPVELLTEGKSINNSNAEAELRENAKKLIDTLDSFSVGAKIVGYCRGPSITRYEIQPAPGVKISKITGLSDDIALNLAAQGVRIEAPIPGKPAIGIEVPNKTITSVTIRELIDSNEFRKNKSKLACVLGRDVAGKIIITDLAKMPHLLIAGTTGSGKSVCVNGILMSLIFRASPEEVKLILIDPKLVEFSKYKGIPHLLVPVVSDVKKAAGALNWAVNEMEERYKEFSVYNVKDIDSYNKMVAKNLETMTDEELEEDPHGEVIDGEFIPPKATKKMPKIVIAIDELADLMMVAPGEVEESICRLAQKARAAGMHLVIATQRPSVNVITGVIKANIPSRISLKVASYVDSKTILDTAGGEKLIGRGDMLYNPVGAPKPIRVQGGFSSDDDIEAVTDYIKNHSSADYDESVTQEIDRIAQEELSSKGGGKDSGGDDDIDDSDPMLEDAIKLVVEAGQASTSLLQRRLRLGYARAGRLIDTMEQMGIVGPHEGSKSRKVLLTPEQWLERKVTGSNE